MKIRPFKEKDLTPTSTIHRAAFPRQQLSSEWIACCWKSFPKSLLFVSESGQGEVTGYIHWVQKSGFRNEAVLELEQLAVEPKYHGQGIGSLLITESLPLVATYLQQRDAKIKHIMVTTRADNHAQHLYKKTLNAEIETTITNLYSADEVIMISRNWQP